MSDTATILFSGEVVNLSDVEAAIAGRGEVAEVAAVGINDVFVGDALHVFVVLADDVPESYDLRKTLLTAITEQTGGPRPRGLRFVDALPKKGGVPSRDAIREAASATDVRDLEALDDPAAVDAIRSAR